MVSLPFKFCWNAVIVVLQIRNYLAKMVPSLPFEAQASAYGILLKFLTSTKKAQERAAVWFEEWPSLQNVFIDSYSKHFSEVFTHRN